MDRSLEDGCLGRSVDYAGADRRCHNFVVALTAVGDLLPCSLDYHFDDSDDVEDLAASSHKKIGS